MVFEANEMKAEIKQETHQEMRWRLHFTFVLII